MLPRDAAVKSRCSGFKYGRSMSVTCTGICIALRVVLAISWLSIVVAASDAEDALRQPELIEFRSGDLDLKGFIWKPAGAGPFPAILWNHGSEKRPGAVDSVATFFVTRGYVFFVPHRERTRLTAAAPKTAPAFVCAEATSGDRMLPASQKGTLQGRRHLSGPLAVARLRRPIGSVHR